MLKFTKSAIEFKDKLKFQESDSLISGNRKYIIYSINYKIIFYSLDNGNAIKANEIIMNNKIKQLAMNEIYENIFLIRSIGEVNIFEISRLEDDYICKERIKIKSDDTFTYAKFSKYNKKMLGTISNDNLIRIWDIDLNFNYLTIKMEDFNINNIFFNQNKNTLMIYLNDKNNKHYFAYIYDISYGTKLKKEIKRINPEIIFEISEKDFIKN